VHSTDADRAPRNARNMPGAGEEALILGPLWRRRVFPRVLRETVLRLQSPHLSRSQDGSELALDQSTIVAAECHEFIVCAELDYTPGVEDSDLVSALDRGKSVGHHQACS